MQAELGLLGGPDQSPFHPAELKSAMQKYMRRGMVDQAVAAAWGQIVAGPEHRVGLAKRIGVIIVEDMGWQYLARYYRLAKRWSFGKTNHRQEHEREMLELIAGLTTTPHSQEAEWIVCLCLSLLDKVKWYSASEFEKAMAEKNHVEAVRIAMASHVEKNFFSSIGLVRSVTAAAKNVNPFAQEVVEAALWRAMKGGMKDDEHMLIASAVLAIIDDVKSEPDPWPTVDVPKKVKPSPTLDWYGLDGHTYRGKGALQKVAPTFGMSTWNASMLMFFVESAQLANERSDVRWKQEALEASAQKFCGIKTWAECGEQWAKMREPVKVLIEASIAKKLSGN